jgi:large subunit ribosomal protein L10
MKKLSVQFKEASENRIKKGLKESEAFFVVKYSKLSGPDLNSLRKSLRGVNSEMLVVRNNTARRALKGLESQSLLDLVQGPCGFVFSKKEPVEASKVLFNFTKDHANLKLEGGLLKDKLMNSKDIESLAKLPSREVLLARTAMAMKSPITGFVFVLKGNLRKLVFCLEQVKNKKQ